MLSWFIFSVALWRLRHEQLRADGRYLWAMRRAKAEGAGDDVLTAIAFDEYQASCSIDERVRVLNTRYLLAEADRYLLPRPRWGDPALWVQCIHASGLYLDPGGHQGTTIRHPRGASCTPQGLARRLDLGIGRDGACWGPYGSAGRVEEVISGRRMRSG
jgi:hypothetical protein